MQRESSTNKSQPNMRWPGIMISSLTRKIIIRYILYQTEQIQQDFSLCIYSSMKSLSEFAEQGEVFQEAAVLPQFFETNLVDPARVVKVFSNDPQGHLRIFYYQYLKLCFELQNINFDFYIRKIEEIINSSFHFIFYQDDNPEIFNDNQAKSLIMEFFGVLGEGHANVQSALSHYPIMDYIFVNFFRSFLILMEKTDSLDSYIPRDELLGFLCPYFGVEVEMHNQCIKYVDSDIFVYELNPKAIYMAYMDYERQIQSQSPPTASYQQQQQEEPLPPAPQPPAYQPPAYEPIQTNGTNFNTGSRRTQVIKDSYIADEFMDYTSKAQPSNLTAKLKGNLKQSGTLDKQPAQPPKQATYSYQPSHFKQESGLYSQSNSITNQPATYKAGQFSSYSENINIPTSYLAESKINQIVKPSPIVSQPIKQTFIQPTLKANQSPQNSQLKQQYPYQTNPSYSPQYNYSPSPQITTQYNQYSPSPQLETQYNQYSPSPQLNQYNTVNPTFQSSLSPSAQPLYNQFSPSSQLQYNTYNQPPSPQLPQKSQYSLISQSPQSKNNQLSQSVLKQTQINQGSSLLINQVPSKQSSPKPNQRYQDAELESLIYNPKKDNLLLGSSKTQTYSQVRASSNLTTTVTGKKKPFGLNISEEFTNSQTLKALAEPHRSNVQTMKTRARAFRTNLINSIKRQ